MRKGPHRRSARTKTCGKRYLVCLGKSRENKGSGEARVAGGGERRKIEDQTGTVLVATGDSLDAQADILPSFIHKWSTREKIHLRNSQNLRNTMK